MVPFKSHFAVIFTSTLSKDAGTDYELMASEMEELAKKQDGFLGMDSARSTIGITVSYWDSLEAINQWSKNMRHQMAKEMGKSKWYEHHNTRITKVIREY